MVRESVPAASLEALLAEPLHLRGASISALWRDGASISGSLSPLTGGSPERRLDLLNTLRLLAMTDVRDPDVVARVLENAGGSPANDGAAIHAAASFVVTRPEMLKWVSANPTAVAASPNWKTALPGLGGAVASVPLAEEALRHLVAAKADLPRELTRLVQLNPWFTRRFAIQYRRHAGGKRIRFQDRAETTRAWSHARSLLGSKVPPQWRSPHGRGGTRALDQYSHRVLGRYAALVGKVYRAEGIPATMAALFAIASAADVTNPPALDTLTGWRAFPAAVERDALNLIGIGPSPGSGLEPAEPKDTGIFPLKASRGMVPKISWR